VELGKRERYDVKAPFDLADHTIFLVVRQRLTDRALFRSDTRPDRGVLLGEVLGEKGRSLHRYRDGETGRPAFAYRTALERSESFRLVVLGRQGGRMRSFVDGADRSSMARCATPIRVGAFFELKRTQQVLSDGDGLQLAEMAFYDRFLEDDERRGVTARLAADYDLTLEKSEGGSVQERIESISSSTGIARLGSSAARDLSSVNGTFLSWDSEEKVFEPWRREPKDHPTRLFAMRDAANAHVYLSLAAEAEQPGVKLRVLLRKNGTDWIPGEVEIGPFGGAGEAARAVGTLEARTSLGAGDFLEVVVYRTGTTEGAVRSVPGEVVLLVDAE
jgi:hypothetical protein